MRKSVKAIAPVIGAGTLMATVFSGVLASHPPASRGFSRSAVKAYTVNGRLTVTDVLRVNKNQSVYGRQYAHGGLQVWKGLTISNGGVNADSLSVKGALSAASGTFSGNLQTGTLQSGAIGGTTLALTGAGTVGGALNVAGKITGNGVDAGSGGVTTTGNVAGSGFSASTITDSGTLSAGSITTSGSLSAGSAALGSLQVAGNVNFSGATVTGLNLGGSNLSSLTVGNTASSSAPLNLSANGKTIPLGVNGNGALTVDNLAVNSGVSVGGNGSIAGNLVLGGSGGLTTSLVTAPNTSGTSTPGPLGITGSTITLTGNSITNGNATFGQGGDIFLSIASGNASHINASGDGDVAGSFTVTPPANQATEGDTTVTVNFTQPYTTVPNVVVTATSNPNQGTSGTVVPSVWVAPNLNGSTNQYTGFTFHYMVSSTSNAPATVKYNYHVLGS